MEGYQALRPGGPCYRLVGSAGVTRATQLTIGPQSGDAAFVIWNRGPSDAWLAVGKTSAVVVANAIMPLVGAEREVVPLPAGSVQTFTFFPQPFMSVAVQQGTAEIDVLPGYGA